MEDVTHLVGNDLGVADDRVDVGVGMAVDPNVYVAVGNEIAEFCGEDAIEVGAFMLGGNYLQGRQVVGCYHNVVGGTLSYTLLDEVKAIGVQAVVVFDRQAFAVELCLVEVVHTS